MRNDAPATATKVAAFTGSNDKLGQPQPTIPPADPLLAFASEDDPDPRPGVPATLPPAVKLEKPTPSAIDNPAPASATAAEPRPTIRWMPIAIGLLALVIIGQAALIVRWFAQGTAPPVPDTGSITIQSDPAGAAVAVDGASRGVTPLTLALTPGSHSVSVGEGAGARSQTVNVTRGGEASVHVALASPPPAIAAKTGGLQITTEPAGARVFLDGINKGTSPVTVSDLEPGPHAVRVVGENGAAVTRRVTVEPGTLGSLVVSMAAGAQFASGWLAVTSPIPVQISEAGTLLGTTDTPRIMVPAGRHDLVFANVALGFRATRTVQIAAGQTATFTLEVPRGTLNVNALPWADVWIDGRSVGETPIGNLSLTLGTHELILRHPDLGERRRTVVITAGGPTRIGVDLRKEPQ